MGLNLDHIWYELDVWLQSNTEYMIQDNFQNPNTPYFVKFLSPITFLSQHHINAPLTSILHNVVSFILLYESSLFFVGFHISFPRWRDSVLALFIHYFCYTRSISSSSISGCLLLLYSLWSRFFICFVLLVFSFIITVNLSIIIYWVFLMCNNR